MLLLAQWMILSCVRPPVCAVSLNIQLHTLLSLSQRALTADLAADAALPYLRRIKDLAPPEELGQRPACVDMRVRVSFFCTNFCKLVV